MCIVMFIQIYIKWLTVQCMSLGCNQNKYVIRGLSEIVGQLRKYHKINIAS